MRRIVVLHSNALEGPLGSADSLEAASFIEQSVETPGVVFRKRAVRLPKPTPRRHLPRTTEGLIFPRGQTVAFDADFADEDAERRLVHDRPGMVEGVYSNPPLKMFGTICPTRPIGAIKKVEAHLRLDALHDAGHRGRGVRIAVVDSGVDQVQVPVAGGIRVRPDLPAPGKSISDHGTMVAFDALIAAPDATILDVPLFGPKSSSIEAVVWSAVCAFEALLDLLTREPGPLIVVNSWGMADTRHDKPIGDPGNYGSNPLHPLNVITESLVAAGADVFFAAGNCGGGCPFADCGPDDRGPAKSIHGANSHPDVISIGAVTVNDDVLGYSSEGPASLFAQKPDVSASSHFLGSKVGAAVDRGTSAACGVAAGVAAALRSIPQAAAVSPLVLKTVLMDSARQPGDITDGWNPQTGWGVIDAAEAARHFT